MREGMMTLMLPMLWSKVSDLTERRCVFVAALGGGAHQAGELFRPNSQPGQVVVALVGGSDHVTHERPHPCQFDPQGGHADIEDYPPLAVVDLRLLAHAAASVVSLLA